MNILNFVMFYWMVIHDVTK